MIKVNSLQDNYPVKISQNTPGDSFGQFGSIEKLKNDLGWNPKFSLEDGLREFFKWINKVPIKEDISDYHPLKLTCFDEKFSQLIR